MTHDATQSGPAESSAIVEIESGRVRGEIYKGISIFRGIPYGAGTEGANRFLPPRPPASWTGVRDVVDYGQTAPQAPGWLSEGGFEGRRPEMGEDCLCLNVWTPAADSGKRPVLVWLHGGGFEAGSGSSLLYDGTHLARRGDVVVLTVNHRLGIFGHCHLEDLFGEAFAGSANAGYLDVVAALRWVNANIAQFGGDPDNVTVLGQSGGGRKVSLLTASNMARGLFHRGIVQSGSHLRLMSRARANELSERLLRHFDLKRTDAHKLQHIPWRDLRRANRDITRETRLRYSPTLDATTFAAHPWDPEAPSSAATIPMMIGTCRTELSNQLGNGETFALDDAGLTERLRAFVPAEDVAALVALFKHKQPRRICARALLQDHHRARLLARQRPADRSQGATGRRSRLFVPPHVAHARGWRSPHHPALARPAFHVRQRGQGASHGGSRHGRYRGDGKHDEPDLARVRSHRQPEQPARPGLAALRPANAHGDAVRHAARGAVGPTSRGTAGDGSVPDTAARKSSASRVALAALHAFGVLEERLNYSQS